jgi:two-component system LytT family response regulator
MLKILMVESKPSLRKNLRETIASHCHRIQIVAELDTPAEIPGFLRRNPSDLMVTRLSLVKDCVPEPLDLVSESPLLLTLLTRQGPYAIWELVAGSIGRLLGEAYGGTEPFPALLRPDSPAQERMPCGQEPMAEGGRKLAVPCLEGIEYVDMAEILYCESDKSYTEIHRKSQAKITSSRNLGRFEEVLDPRVFFRVHNSFLVNLREVTRYLRGEGGELVLSNGAVLPVSRRRKEDFLLKMGALGAVV